MALGQDEAVALRILGARYAEDAAVEGGQDVGDAERRADMAHAGAPGLIQDDAADVAPAHGGPRQVSQPRPPAPRRAAGPRWPADPARRRRALKGARS